MKKYSITGSIFALLYVLLGLLIVYDDITSKGSGALGYLVYLAPWSFFADIENPFFFLSAFLLNAGFLFLLGKGVGHVFLLAGKTVMYVYNKIFK
jgi:hypothetical protein